MAATQKIERELVTSYRLHSNFSSILMRFRDIAVFCAPARHFSHPTPRTQSPQNFSMFPWEQVDDLLATKSEDVGLIVRAIVSKIFHLCGHDPPTSRTDDKRQQDRALHCSASCGKNVRHQYQLPPAGTGWNKSSLRQHCVACVPCLPLPPTGPHVRVGRWEGGEGRNPGHLASRGGPCRDAGHHGANTGHPG